MSRDARPAATRGDGADVDAPPLSLDGEEDGATGSIRPAAATLRLWLCAAGRPPLGGDARLGASAGRVAGAARARELRPRAFMSKAIRKGHEGSRSCGMGARGGNRRKKFGGK